MLSRVFAHSPPPDRMSAIQQRAECTRSARRLAGAKASVRKGAPTSCRLSAKGHAVPSVIPCSPRRTECLAARRMHALRPPLRRRESEREKERRYSVGCRQRDILSRVIPRSPRRTGCPPSSSAQNARAPCPEFSRAVPAGQDVRHPAARRMHALRPPPRNSQNTHAPISLLTSYDVLANIYS
jgi:hypothetical protein